MLTATLIAGPAAAYAATYYVATDGDDTTGNGSSGNPWASLETALLSVPDGSTILARAGTYYGRQRLRGTFTQGVTVRSEEPYRAQLRHNDTVVTCFYGQGITFEGFDVAHEGPGAAALVVQIQDLIDGTDFVRRITLRNNVFHDSYNNDLVKINNGAAEITVSGNVFYNQSGSDEHIDANSVADVVIEDNIFFNDFAGSGRPNNNDTSSYIVVKDSNGADDGRVGSERVTVRRNVFLGWEGSTGSNFVLIGEDGQAYHEARDVMIENNLMLGNSSNVMRAPMGVKGGRDITFRNNTVAGDLPSLAFAMRLNVEGANPNNLNVLFYNNVYSDPSGSMDDFSDTPPGETDSFALENNLYWNGGVAIPEDPGELLNYTDDPAGLVADPLLGTQGSVALPRWVSAAGQFADGSTSVTEAFRRLVDLYGTPDAASPVEHAAAAAEAPADDILGHPRDSAPDIGSTELGVIFTDGFESGDTSAW